ncbi:MbtH family protein [Paraburkholderia acidicola]|uniref:MbtH family NRPS accessory protein n=1 Tax=Paraburkholderia acidicola TaxID=1912599 RepID=A0A2A4F4M6_9BURK|nr:MbtH family NRPS accessory protein [Paraburkholderia acidicola]PCE27309.1 MbtH family protein [Paraburkholderia acidicola]
MSWGDENTHFHVVINDEEQYSIWPDYKAIPAGWREAGKSGKKEECLAWIDEVWTDMRPLSLRKAMADDAARDTATRTQSSAT